MLVVATYYSKLLKLFRFSTFDVEHVLMWMLANIVVSIVWYVLYCMQKFTHRKCSWIIQYINVFHMNRIVLVNRKILMIHRHRGLKWVFLLKFVALFDLNKLLDFFNTKLLGNLIESNKIASPWVPPPLSFSYKIKTILITLTFICANLFSMLLIMY